MSPLVADALDVVDDLLAYLTSDEREQLDQDLRAIAPKPKGRPVPTDWRQRVPLVFPRAASAPFADRHVELWEWENAISLDSAPRPFVGLWPRGGGKSSSAEMAVTDLGCRDRRRYCLYVRMTQDKADDSVQNIAIRMESAEVARHYPDHAQRKVGKFGNAKGWRRNRIWTAGGFAVDALGIDVASRGVKLEDQRPDLIVFDDIDGLDDSPAITQKKINIITKSILPAGANNVAVLFIQNLINRDGVAAQLADGRADFLAQRIVSGPFPAVEGLRYEWHVDEGTGMRRAVITGGRATWAGQPMDACQRFVDTWGLSAFLKEAQHKVNEKAEGVCLRFEAARHLVDLPPHQVQQLTRESRTFAGIDFGSWRFGFTLWVVTSAGKVICLDEMFSQGESLRVRARKIHEVCVANGIADPSPRTVPIWGDAANPTDIREMNLAFRDGWPEVDEQGHETGRTITSKLRVVAVMNEYKARKTAVDRINNALDANALVFRRGLGAGTTWRLGQNAGSEGTEMQGSRLLWEIDNWSVPIPKAGHAQDQNPDDDTADGADCVAAMRYALMSWWRPAKHPEVPPDVDSDKAWHFDVKQRAFKEPAHLVDVFTTPTRRTPAVRTPRPRIGR